MGVVLGNLEGLISGGLPGGLPPPDSGGGVPPGIPQNLIAEAGDSLVTLDWDAVVGATRYNVYRGGVFLKDVDALGTEAVDDTAVNGVTYSYTVSATGPGGESAQSAAATVTVAFPADMALDFTGATPGALVTAARLAAAMIGGSGITFDFQVGSSHVGDVPNHTTIETDGTAPSYADAFLIAGTTVYDASESLIVEVDMSGRAGLDDKWEKTDATFPGGTSGQIAVRALIYFPVAGGTDDANIDHMGLDGSDFVVTAQRIPFNDTTTRGAVMSHSGGANGTLYAISDGWKIVDMMGDSDALKGYVMVRNADTGALELASQSALSGTGFSFMHFFSDYLTPYKGVTKWKGLVVAFGTNATHPLGSFTTPAPTGLDVTQSGPSELTFSWTSALAHSWTVRKRTNGGAWSTVSTAQTTASYVDSSVAAGESIEYGVTATIATHSSSEAVSDAFVVLANLVVAHVPAGPGQDGGTTSAINTTGAGLLVAVISDYSGNPAAVLSDSKGNTWANATEQVNGVGPANRVRILYCVAPVVGTGHTFTLTGTGIYASIVVTAFSGDYVFDQENGANYDSVSSSQTGSITPTDDGALIVIAGGFSSAATPSSTGFVVVDTVDYVGGATLGVTAAYKQQTTAAAINPTIDFGGTVSGAAKIVNFKPAP